MKFALKLPKRASKATETGPQEAMADPPTGSEAPASIWGRLFERKRALRVIALLTVAWAAGQMVQSLQLDSTHQKVATTKDAPAALEPTAIVTLSGSAQDDMVQNDLAMQAEAEASAAMTVAIADPAIASETATQATADAPPVIQLAAVTGSNAALTTQDLAASPVQLVAATTESAAASVTDMAEPAATASACPVTMDLSVVPGAVLGVTLIARCAPNARVVLQHEGLSITGVTTATGALFTSIPAMTTMAEVKATLAGGISVNASVAVPEAAQYRRFAVQWQGDDAFQVNAYENGAAFGQPGHISDAQPGLASDVGSFLQRLGDPLAAMPLLAEVYTYPLTKTPVAIEVEAAVTDKTCGREMIGETVFSDAGSVVVTDLTLAMPGCDAIGDFLVLNNLVPDVTLAAN